MLTKESALEALTELKDKIRNINDEYTLKSWRNIAVNNIIRIYGRGSEPIEQVNFIRYVAFSKHDNNLREVQYQCNELIDSLIIEINRFDLPEQTSDDSRDQLHINITQSQNQETKIRLNLIIESIQEHLTGAQLKEIQQVIDDKEKDLGEKKASIIDKLQKFGTDVGSNILANILTNPAIFG